MTRHSPVRFLLAALTAALLPACGGGDVGVDERAAGAGASAEQETDDGSATSGGTAPDADQDGGSPGGPGSDPDGNDGDVQGQGNPGGPGDVAVFEEAGVTFGTLRNGSAQSVCVEQGLCTLADPVVTAGDPDDLGGVDECLIREQSDIRYDPTARNGVFPEGATVTAHVDCTDPDAEEPGDPGSGEADPGEADPDDPGTGDPGTGDPGTDDSTDDGTGDSPDEETDGTDDGTDGGTDGGMDGGTDGGTDGDGAGQSQG